MRIENFFFARVRYELTISIQRLIMNLRINTVLTKTTTAKLRSCDLSRSLAVPPCTILAWKLRKTGQVMVVLPRWSPHDAHCTRACPGGVVYVVGVLG